MSSGYSDDACTCWRGPNHGTACPLYTSPAADPYSWPATTADTLRAQLLATRKADDAERFARLLRSNA